MRTDGARRVRILAHRGASLEAPQNTLPAFHLAVRQGADAIETDVHWTKDREIVICHDHRIDAVSDGRGEIAEMTYEELLRYDFGYWFTADGGRTYPYRGRGVRILTLREALRAFPSIHFNIDLKPKRPHVGLFLRALEEEDALARVTLASFHHRTLAEARARCPRLRTSASPQEVARVLAMVRAGWRPRAGVKPSYQALQVPYRRYGLTVVTRRFVEAAHQMGVEVDVWTVDDPAEMLALVRQGVDGIVTNSPQILQKLLLELEQ
ncbi:glycerophosphodiester phosphodiesterase [Alicyclobacillus vulcanalis]|uniref:Glycerophosphoryl diester phosphodiesterase n=1 Tax=Alicyclobacillus vulcanalis TaxID=252246 RepID=A0A1N7LX18_9BACL|nr:glycerophosphodiester phosphodiesterase [Alicyclobacillus vulcanalis]SIS78344.1 glycerophosphoryl diester phosphodiesterase [Alicyclobacillus vulcanalis]